MVSCYWQKVKLNKEGKMRGSTQNGRRLLEMLMGYPRTIAPPPNALFFTRSFILRPIPPSYAPPRLTTTTSMSMSMSTVDQSSEGGAHLDHLFKQKRILRSRVKKDLKSMDPTLRSQEGIPQHTYIIYLIIVA